MLKGTRSMPGSKKLCCFFKRNTYHSEGKCQWLTKLSFVIVSISCSHWCPNWQESFPSGLHQPFLQCLWTFWILYIQGMVFACASLCPLPSSCCDSSSSQLYWRPGTSILLGSEQARIHVRPSYHLPQTYRGCHSHTKPGLCSFPFWTSLRFTLKTLIGTGKY